uniref:Uncharacterized protein n=1 Tax=Chromera velia CCMP2878 TaxID=1169474 RepID=A0A0G4IE14_9ALVE|eukprot:Cvel_13465.t1-p1 / transcript=Cvel_13465.t1 / gene=Cvel_13465 / organism=Chromera_velia_CCMP2878 / gene_product=hypothetical protein / transcript_product=hypothetical protein / location=Cvel_scaffold921:9482-9949(+) / protein_length=156 / sequence_SO=supercontig / SO=protein_coding / is_pseudo=false
MVFGKRRLSLLIWSSDTDKYMHEASALANKVGGRLLDSTRAPVARIADGDFALVQKFCYAVSSVSVPPQHEGKYRILIDEGKRMLGVHCGWKEMEQVLSKFDSRKEEDEMGAGAFEQIPEHVLLHECDYNNCSDRVNEWPEKVANFYRSAEVEEDT